VMDEVVICGFGITWQARWESIAISAKAYT
jgi:hypothetical protein